MDDNPPTQEDIDRAMASKSYQLFLGKKDFDKEMADPFTVSKSVDDLMKGKVKELTFVYPRRPFIARLKAWFSKLFK